MRLNLKVSAAMVGAAATAFAIAMPAAAHPGKLHSHSSHSSKSSHRGFNNKSGTAGSKSHKCKPHNVAYVESGTLDSTTASSLAANQDGTWSGTLVVDVLHANHWAKADKGTTVTYTLSSQKLTVRFDSGATSFSGGERVKLIGKLAVVGKKCTALSPAATPVFRRVVVHPAPSQSSSTQSSSTQSSTSSS